jgi:hypothetical protein
VDQEPPHGRDRQGGRARDPQVLQGQVGAAQPQRLAVGERPREPRVGANGEQGETLEDGRRAQGEQDQAVGRRPAGRLDDGQVDQGADAGGPGDGQGGGRRRAR